MVFSASRCGSKELSKTNAMIRQVAQSPSRPIIRFSRQVIFGLRSLVALRVRGLFGFDFDFCAFAITLL